MGKVRNLTHAHPARPSQPGCPPNTSYQHRHSFSRLYWTLQINIPLGTLIIVWLFIDFILYQKRSRRRRLETHIRTNWGVLHRLAVGRADSVRRKKKPRKTESLESLESDELPDTNNPTYYDTIGPQPSLSPMERWMRHYDVNRFGEMENIENPRSLPFTGSLSKSTTDIGRSVAEGEGLHLDRMNNNHRTGSQWSFGSSMEHVFKPAHSMNLATVLELPPAAM